MGTPSYILVSSPYLFLGFRKRRWVTLMHFRTCAKPQICTLLFALRNKITGQQFKIDHLSSSWALFHAALTYLYAKLWKQVCKTLHFACNNAPCSKPEAKRKWKFGIAIFLRLTVFLLFKLFYCHIDNYFSCLLPRPLEWICYSEKGGKFWPKRGFLIIYARLSLHFHRFWFLCWVQISHTKEHIMGPKP